MLIKHSVYSHTPKIINIYITSFLHLHIIISLNPMLFIKILLYSQSFINTNKN